MITFFWVISFAHSLHSFRLANFFRKWRPCSLLNMHPSELGAGALVHQPALSIDERGTPRRAAICLGSQSRAREGRTPGFLSGHFLQPSPSSWFSLLATGVPQCWGQAEWDRVGAWDEALAGHIPPLAFFAVKPSAGQATSLSLFPQL